MITDRLRHVLAALASLDEARIIDTERVIDVTVNKRYTRVLLECAYFKEVFRGCEVQQSCTAERRSYELEQDDIRYVANEAIERETKKVTW